MGKLLSFIVGMFFCIHAYTMDVCSQIVGHWRGTFTIKEPSICEMFDGCTHNIFVNVMYPPEDIVHNTAYEALVSPSAGIGEIYYITCDNGVITSLLYPGNTITSFCNAEYCEVVYEDKLLYSKMSKKNTATS